MYHRRAFLQNEGHVIRGDENSMVADWLRQHPNSVEEYVIP